MPEKDKKNKKKITERLLSLLGISYENKPNDKTIVIGDNEISHKQHFGLPKNLRGRYQFQKILGKGGYGIVYLARDVLIGRLVALKLLYKMNTDSHEIYDHFLQEARIAGQLDHENIVVIYNVEEDSKCTCIIMEYLGEGNLATYLDEKGQLSTRATIRIIKGILEGLSIAHNMRVIHRDIKPENILFDHKNRPKISDFGIAHLPVDSGGVTGENEYKPVGTPHYMAPEQLKGEHSIDARVDLFSVGALMYKMLSGQDAYEFGNEENTRNIIDFVEKNEPQNLHKMNPDIPSQLADIVMTLLNKDPLKRYASAKEVLNVLKKIQLEVPFNSLEDEIEEEEEDDDTRSIASSRENLLEDVLRLLLVDGIMSLAERRELEKRAERLKVPANKARELEEKIRKEMHLPTLKSVEAFQETVTIMASDGNLSHAEKKVLEKTSNILGIQEEEREMIEKDALKKRSKE